MVLVDDDEMVETLSAQGPDHSLRDGVGVWRMDRRGDCVDADTQSALPKIAAIDGVAIVEEMAGFLAPWCGLNELPPDPGTVSRSAAHRWGAWLRRNVRQV